jgi:soluble lytic murein transglycosylase
MYKKYRYVLFLFLIYYSVTDYADDTIQSRQLFWQARQSLLTKHYQQFAQLQGRLKNYPLYPYLLYIKLNQQLAYQNQREIDDFLETYQDTPLANKLRAEYLIQAAKRREWSQFIHYYRPVYGPAIQCYYLNALITTQQQHTAYQAIPELWLTLHSPPSICRNVFSRWESTGRLNRELLWQKLEQAILENNVLLLQHLVHHLPYEQRQQVKHWYRVHRHPLLVKQKEFFNANDKIDRKIVLHGMHQLVAKDPRELAKNWSLLHKSYHFTEAEKQELLRDLAIALARRADNEAGQWLSQIKPAFTNTVLREWRVRQALREENWSQVLDYLAGLTPTEQKLLCWQYWRARALAATQQTQRATDIYQQLAKQVDYYGVLASQRLNQSYRPTTTRVRGDSDALQQNKAIQRARELYALGFIGDARREWQWALEDDLSKTQLPALAQLAQQWKWYDLAIIAAAKAGIHNDIKLRFPLAYRPAVLSAARKARLNSAWIWAIMRQESAFMPAARSCAGALGLMQLMPTTGKSLARDLHLHTTNFIDPEINIRLGSFYLRYLLKIFDGNATLATAAYNAGPTRIKNYQALYKRLPQDVWVEILPWKETRDYIKSVSLARNIYKQI